MALSIVEGWRRLRHRNMTWPKSSGLHWWPMCVVLIGAFGAWSVADVSGVNWQVFTQAIMGLVAAAVLVHPTRRGYMSLPVAVSAACIARAHYIIFIADRAALDTIFAVLVLSTLLVWSVVLSATTISAAEYHRYAQVQVSEDGA